MRLPFKIMLGGILSLVVILTIGAVATSEVEPASSSTSPDVAQELPGVPIPHEVRAREDLSTGSATRIDLRVSAEPGTTRSQLADLSADLVASERSRGSYVFFDRPEVDGAAPLGRATDWARAHESAAGYSNHALDTGVFVRWTGRDVPPTPMSPSLAA